MKSILLSSLLAALVAPSIAFSADGSMTFSGSLATSTCTYTGTGNKSQIVTLPTISLSALSRLNERGGYTRFDVILTGCGSAPRDVTIRLTSDNVTSTGVLHNTAGPGRAQNMFIELRTLTDDMPLPATVPKVQSNPQGEATISLMVGYVAGNNATAGSVSIPVNFSIIYP